MYYHDERRHTPLSSKLLHLTPLSLRLLFPPTLSPLISIIKFGGIDMKELDPRWLRMQIGVVPQVPLLFNVSIAANICYGLDVASMQIRQRDIEYAAKFSAAHEWIMKLPHGCKYSFVSLTPFSSLCNSISCTLFFFFPSRSSTRFLLNR